MNKPSYAILRVGKIHTRRQLRAAAEHNDRTAARGLEHTEGTPADNIPIIGDPDVLATWDAKMEAKGLDPAKQRKDGVMALEWVASASPEFFRTATLEQRTKWATETMAFIQEQAGGADNVLAVYLHDDEETPHIHALTIPLIEKERKAKGRPRKGRPAPQKAVGRSWGLSAADLIGGPKDRLSALQDAYAEAVADTGLVRGVRRKETGARNLSPAQFRARNALLLDEMAGEIQGAVQEREAAAGERVQVAKAATWLKGLAQHIARDAERVGVAIDFPAYAKDPAAESSRQAVEATIQRAKDRARAEQEAKERAAYRARAEAQIAAFKASPADQQEAAAAARWAQQQRHREAQKQHPQVKRRDNDER